MTLGFMLNKYGFEFGPSVWHFLKDMSPEVKDLLFTPHMDEDKNNQTTCAKNASPVLKWESEWTGIAWHVKQTSQGLQPQRPVVVATQGVEIDVGQSLLVDTLR